MPTMPKGFERVSLEEPDLNNFYRIWSTVTILITEWNWKSANTLYCLHHVQFHSVINSTMIHNLQGKDQGKEIL